MALSDELIQVVDDILEDFGPCDRTVSLRVITRTGSYQLIGRSVAVSYSDTLLDPPPVFRRITRNDAILSGNDLVLPDDYIFVISVNSMTKAQLESKDSVLVLKTSSGEEEILRIITWENPATQLIEVAYIVVARSINRP